MKKWKWKSLSRVQLRTNSPGQNVSPNREYQLKKNYFKARRQTKPTSGVEKYNSASELYFRPMKIGNKKKPLAMCQHNLAKNSIDLTRDSQNNFTSKRTHD